MTVYFVRRGDSGAVKIGAVTDVWNAPGRKTAAEYRLAALEKDLGVPLHFAALAPGHRFVEHWFHRRYRAGALGHEWFRPLPILLEDVAALAAGDRVNGQPEEPGVACIAAHLIRYYRVDLLRVTADVMSAAIGYKNIQNYWTAERQGLSILRAVEIAEFAQREGVDLSVARIVRDASGAAHRSRYQAHAVRDCAVTL